MTTSQNELWKLLESKEPDEVAVMNCIDHHPEYCSIKTHGNFPIQIAIEKTLSMDVINKLLASYPECCIIKNAAGNLLLHEVLYSLSTISSEVIFLILNSNLDAVKVANSVGNFPLHIECSNKCRYEIINKLFSLHPDAIIVFNVYNYLPLHCALFSDHDSSEAIFLLISQYEEAVHIVDGYIPLHLECVHQCRLHIIKKLLEINPQSINKLDHNGQYPLHCALYNKRDSSYETVLYLIQLAPDIVHMVDKNGCLPLHIECSNPLWNQHHHAIIMKLLEIYPESISIATPAENLPLHIILSSKSSPDAIRLILHRYPAACRFPIIIPYYLEVLPFSRIFQIYCTEYDNFTSQSTALKSLAIESLDLYPEALNYHIPMPIASYIKYVGDGVDPRKYRILLNLASHYISSSKQIQDYHAMNWSSRCPLLHLLLRLSMLISSSATNMAPLINLQHQHQQLLMVETVINQLEVPSFRMLKTMIAATGRIDHRNSRYNWMKGDDLGCILLRNVMSYI